MKDRAYAKINLSLDVFNIREDGYHDLLSIMLPIDFYDELEISIDTQDSFSCNRHFIRYNEKNSIYKMISLIKERYGIKDHHKIVLNKVIPTQAGLGGGTADAASTLRIFEKMYSLDLSREEIIDMCVKVGADVPFNYFNTPAIVSGIGEGIKPFPLKKQYYILLAKPRSGVSTKEAYETLDMEKCDHPDIMKLKKALENGENIHGLLGNSLEQPALLLNDDIRRVKQKLQSYEAGEVLMSGSGSTVFCISENERDILNIYEDMKGNDVYLRFTKTLNF
ncbi:MAG: 4-(cytidine 5'-diphospho)-2-C-methyl-D-erythritol kinase [Erysipelotrichaceae bacterium]|nr:4-(cytidine 5'-diphospho)-2-C-methyl-D-erythritol kinase [Erysipelotrichaceae bacterium]